MCDVGFGVRPLISVTGGDTVLSGSSALGYSDRTWI